MHRLPKLRAFSWEFIEMLQRIDQRAQQADSKPTCVLDAPVYTMTYAAVSR